MGVRGQQGAMGDMGDMGDMGKDGVSCWDLNSDRVCSADEDIDLSGTCDVHDCTAVPVPGPAGPQGATGPQGPAGPTGPQGPQGPQGATGAQGPAGATGAQGPQGATGPMGPIGMTGATGATGARGPTGLTGATGATGMQGPAGPAGATGAAGQQGPQGPKGDQGDQGDPGPVSIASCPADMIQIETPHSTLCWHPGTSGTWTSTDDYCDLHFRARLCTLAQWRTAVCRSLRPNPGRSFLNDVAGTGSYAVVGGCAASDVVALSGTSQVQGPCCLEWQRY